LQACRDTSVVEICPLYVTDALCFGTEFEKFEEYTMRQWSLRQFVALTAFGMSGMGFVGVLQASAADSASVATASRASPVNGSWRFAALLDGKPIGQHSFTLNTDGDERKLVSNAQFTVKFFGITAYRYRHLTTELWRGECLAGMTANTDDNGKPSSVRTLLDESKVLKVLATTPRHPKGAPPLVLKNCVKSFAYWNPLIQTQTQLLNAQTGELETVQVSRVGTGVVPVRGTPVNAVRWRINGPEAPIELWYSTKGDWIGLDSTVAGGRKLTYRLQ
jgi:hypothetical protein